MGRLALAITLVLSGAGLSCGRMTGERLDVALRPTAGIRAGDGVYLAGIRVGSTGVPQWRDGIPIVPIYVDMRVLPRHGMVFLVADDAGARKRLSVVAFAGAPPAGTPPLYQGAANELELAGVVGTTEARRLMRGLAEWDPAGPQ